MQQVIYFGNFQPSYNSQIHNSFQKSILTQQRCCVTFLFSSGILQAQNLLSILFKNYPKQSCQKKASKVNFVLKVSTSTVLCNQSDKTIDQSRSNVLQHLEMLCDWSLLYFYTFSKFHMLILSSLALKVEEDTSNGQPSVHYQ